MTDQTADNDDLVKTVVYSYDLATLGVHVSLPENFKDAVLTDELIAAHMPNVTERAQVIAYQSCFAAFCAKNKDATLDEFKANLTEKDFQLVTDNILGKITPEVPSGALKEHFRVKFLNLTRVNLKKQVKFDE